MSGYAQPRIALSTAEDGAKSVSSARRTSLLKSAHYYFLLVFVFLLYSQIPVLFPALDAVRPTYTIGGLAILALLIERMVLHKGLDFVWPDTYLLVAFIGAAGLSCLSALWLRAAVDNLSTLIKIAILCFLIVNCIDSGARLRKLIWLMVLCGLFPAVGTLAHYVQRNFVEDMRVGWVGIFENPNEVAYSLVVLVPLAAVLASGARPSKACLLWLIIAVYVAAIYVTFSRGGILALLAVLALLGFRSKNILLQAMMALVLAASVVFMMYGWSRSQGFIDLSEDMNVQSRMVTIKGGLEMFFDHPISGVGLGCSMYAWPLYAPAEMHEKWLIIHNTFVQALAETGVIGFVSFTLLIGVALLGARRLSRRSSGIPQEDNSDLAMGLELSIWGFLVCSISGGFVLTWFPYMLAALVTSLKKVTAESPVPVHRSAINEPVRI